MIAVVILAAAVVGIAGTLAATYQQQKNQVSASEATQLARQLLEEISAKPFIYSGSDDKPGYSAGNKNRNDYDEIDDYNGFTDVSTEIATLSGEKAAIGSAGPYTRSVKVVLGPLPPGHATTQPSDSQNFKTVTITVTRPNAPPIVVSKVFSSARLSS